MAPAPDRSENDHAHQPRRIGAGDGEHDHRDRAGNPARQQQAQADEAHQHDGAGDDTDGSSSYVRGLQTSTTCRSVTASSTVPEYRWLNMNLVLGWRRLSSEADSQLMWLNTSPGPVASTMATSAPSTSASSGAVASVSPE